MLIIWNLICFVVESVIRRQKVLLLGCIMRGGVRTNKHNTNCIYNMFHVWEAVSGENILEIFFLKDLSRRVFQTSIIPGWMEYWINRLNLNWPPNYFIKYPSQTHLGTLLSETILIRNIETSRNYSVRKVKLVKLNFYLLQLTDQNINNCFVLSNSERFQYRYEFV